MLAALALLVATGAAAQFGRGGNSSIAAHTARPDSFDGRFHYCRGVYRMNPGGDGGSWLTDYPLADIDLSVRLAELTKMRVGFDPGGNPQHLIVQLTGDELFQCPFIMMQEVGRLLFNDEDATRLRAYLLKGGFLWVDDFWGTPAWQQWSMQIHKAIPDALIFDIPNNHPIRHMLFPINEVEQVTNINNWERTHNTSERGDDSPHADFRGIADEHGRLGPRRQLPRDVHAGTHAEVHEAGGGALGEVAELCKGRRPVSVVEHDPIGR